MPSPSFDLVPAIAAASASYIEPKAEKRGNAAKIVPQKILFLGQYNSGKTPVVNVPVQILSLGDIQTRAGRGSQAALIYEALSRTAGAVDIYWVPLADNGSGVVATKTITIANNAGSAGTKSFLIGGRKVSFSIASGDTPTVQGAALAAAITADLDNAFTAGAVAGVVTLTARNKGLVPQNLQIISDPDIGDLAIVPTTSTYTIANATAGTLNPVIDTALGNLGDTFYTTIVNPFGDDVIPIAALETAFTTRLGPSVKRPFAAIAGYTDTLANFTSALASRNSPGTCWVPVEGSPSPAYEIAAVAAGILARSNDAHPGVPVRGYTLTGVRGDATKAVWTMAQRDTIVRAGGSWTKLMADGTVQIGDLVTTYKTNTQGVSDAVDNWRFVETIANLQAKLYSLEFLLGSAPYINAVILDDAAVSSQSYVVRPKTLKADLIGLIDSWIANGWSKNRAAIVAGLTVEIDGTNPTRLNAYIPDVFAAGLRIIAIKEGWAFAPAA